MNDTKGKEMIGIVVSTKMKNTVIVEVEHSVRHPLYKKAVRKTKRFAAHNDSLDFVEGDKVRIVETKPISRSKHFRVLEKLT